MLKALRSIGLVALMTALYVSAGKLGLWLAATGSGYAAPVWPPAGIAMALIVFYRRDAAIAIWIGAFLVNFMVNPTFDGRNILLSLLIATGNLAEACITRFLLFRAFKFHPLLRSLRDVLSWFLIGGLVGPICSASVGVLSLIVFGSIPVSKAYTVWTTWLTGNSLAAITVSPVLLLTIKIFRSMHSQRSISGESFKKELLISLFLVTIADIAFFGFSGSRSYISIHLLTYPVLILAALFFPRFGLWFSNLFLSISAIACTSMGYGPFGNLSDPVERLFTLQLFLGSTSVTMALLGTAILERRSKDQLQALEQGRLQNSKMAILGEMAAGMAHEINNPLTTIACNAEFLVQMIEKGAVNHETICLHLGRIQSAALRTLKMVGTLKNFSRDVGQDPFLKSNVKTILEETLELCKSRFERGRVTLRVNQVPDIQIECRPVQISQVILNMMHNSLDAVQTERERWIQVDFTEDVDSVVMTITDSGPGINPEIADKIMFPFFTTKESGKGTGLGLSISKGIIEQHKGKLNLNRSSENTQFIIQLPKTQTHNQIHS